MNYFSIPKKTSFLTKALALALAVSLTAFTFVGCSFAGEETSSVGDNSVISSFSENSENDNSLTSSVGSVADAWAESSVNESSEISLDESSENSIESSEDSIDSSVEESSEASSEEVSEEESSEPEESSKTETSDSENNDNGFDYNGPSVTDGPGNGGNAGGGEWPSPFDEDYFDYQTEYDMENNIFWDSLEYTGYNMEKHIADGRMWEYVLSSRKTGLGWLSNITYAGGSLGYETTSDGKPDIGFFEDHGLVCASYLAYVFFNYLPNVAGIDTSALTKPTLSYSAQDWYIACQDWVKKGYSEYIEFDASMHGGFIKFIPEKDIPIGSVICFRNIDNPAVYCRHVAIYAGYKNGYHWVYHVGNENGPEFCVVERMSYGPGAQFPISIITTPNFILDAMEKNG